MFKRLLLVRHARVKSEFVGRLIGASDVPLDPASVVQTKALAKRILQWMPEVCYCSPLVRCRETARRIVPHLPLQLDADLREIDFGRWENRTIAEIASVEPILIDRWAAFTPEFCFPGGEAVKSFLERIQKTVDRIQKSEEKNILFVTHGGVIRAMICYLLGLESRKYVAFDVPYAGLAVIDIFDGKGVFTALERLETPEDKHG